MTDASEVRKNELVARRRIRSGMWLDPAVPISGWQWSMRFTGAMLDDTRLVLCQFCGARWGRKLIELKHPGYPNAVLALPQCAQHLVEDPAELLTQVGFAERSYQRDLARLQREEKEKQLREQARLSIEKYRKQRENYRRVQREVAAAPNLQWMLEQQALLLRELDKKRENQAGISRVLSKPVIGPDKRGFFRGALVRR